MCSKSYSFPDFWDNSFNFYIVLPGIKTVKCVCVCVGGGGVLGVRFECVCVVNLTVSQIFGIILLTFTLFCQELKR